MKAVLKWRFMEFVVVLKAKCSGNQHRRYDVSYNFKFALPEKRRRLHHRHPTSTTFFFALLKIDFDALRLSYHHTAEYSLHGHRSYECLFPLSLYEKDGSKTATHLQTMLS